MDTVMTSDQGVPPLDVMSLVTPVSVEPPQYDNGEALMDAIEEVVRARSNPPLAIYVGVPYCAYKCHFCDWVADVPTRLLRSAKPQRALYVEALCQQIRHYGTRLTRMGYVPAYMYWGGGTPTRLESSELMAIGDALRESFDLRNVRQWSVESTPNDLTVEKLDTLLSLGVTRISLGVQSLNARQLQASGRGHTPAQAEAAIELLRASGVMSFNVDVMIGFPEEDPLSTEHTIRRLLELEVPHFSLYPFRTSPTTVVERQVARGQLKPLTLEQQVTAYARAAELLMAAGYGRGQHHSSFRRDEKHEDKDGNYKYALMGDKVGFGSGSESTLGHRVLWNPNKHLAEFIKHPLRFAYAEEFSVASPDLFRNYIGATQMTFDHGLLFNRFKLLTGIDFETIRDLPAVQQLFRYIRDCGGQLIESPEGIRLEPACIDRALIAHETRVADVIQLRAKSTTAQQG